MNHATRTPDDDRRLRRTVVWLVLLLGGGLTLFVGFAVLAPDGEAPSPLSRSDEGSPDEPVELRARSPAPSRVARAGDTFDIAAERRAGWLPDPWPDPDIAGDTPFQRRLSLGVELLRLERAIGEGAFPARAFPLRYVKLRAHLLRLDREPADRLGDVLGGDATAVRGVLADLTKPRRDPEGLRLTTLEEGEDPLGLGATLRVWTLGEPWPLGPLRVATELLRRLDDVGGGARPEGYDVLVTPEMGQDVFPPRTFPWPFEAAGYYTRDDELSVVRGILPPASLQVVLLHELVHAWMGHHRGTWASRFLEEGIAEYLARFRPAGRDLHVHDGLRRNELAALERMLQTLGAVGVTPEEIRFPRLLALSARELYALEWLGYLLAQAAVAYVGPDLLRDAVANDDEARLIRAISEIEWPAFRAFLRREGAGGIPGDAFVAADVVGDDAQAMHEEAVNALSPVTALRRLGARVPANLHPAYLPLLLRPPARFPEQDAARLSSVLEALRSERVTTVHTIVDATSEIQAAFRLAPGADGTLAGFDPAALDVGTRSAFVTALHAELKRVMGTLPLPVHAITAKVTDAELPIVPVGDDFTASSLPAWLRTVAGSAGVVLCIASADTLRERVVGQLAERLGVPPSNVPSQRVTDALAGSYAAALAWQEVDLAAVLVVDLSDGEGDALALAQAFAQRLGPRPQVAYWNPQRPLR